MYLFEFAYKINMVLKIEWTNWFNWELNPNSVRLKLRTRPNFDSLTI